jgi:hypothetical protein
MVEKPVAGRLRPFEREWFLHVAWLFRSLVAPPFHPHILCDLSLQYPSAMTHKWVARLGGFVAHLNSLNLKTAVGRGRPTQGRVGAILRARPLSLF